MPVSTLPEYIVDEATGCWEWQRARNRGWGRTCRDGREESAHRVLYERHVGPIPEGLQIDHLCRNRGCVNPDHLEAVTQRENLRRSLTTKLTPADVRVIRRMAAAGDRPTDIARVFGVSRANVSNIVARRLWADIEDE